MLSRRELVVLFFGIGFSIAGAARSQEPAQEPEEPSYEFFSGNVAEIQSGKLTVVRAITGKQNERRAFVMNADTKVEGKLKTRVRVTVGYVTADGKDIAVRVVVRPPLPKR